MPFVGNQPAQSYSSFAKQDFTTSATTSYTLDYPVANENEVALFINFVRQEPTTAYTASGTSLTLTSATSASDDMYAVFIGKAVQTVNPPAGSVDSSKINYPLTTFSSTGIDDNATSTAITIDSSQNVGIGTASPSNTLEIAGSGTPININSTNDEVKKIQFENSGVIQGYYGCSSGTPMRILNGSSTELMRISSAGNLGIGTTSPSTHKLQVTGEFTGTSAGAALFQNTHSTVAAGDEVVRIQFSGDNDATGGHFVNFYDSGGDIGRINVASASTTQYATTSDYRLKENIKDIENAIDKLKLLKPRNFNFIKKSDVSMDGFIAHELQEIVPLAVDGVKDQMRIVKDANGNDVEQIYPQAVDASKLIPILTKALQEAMERIETLEARITTLENA
jgi:hypothetical protein